MMEKISFEPVWSMTIVLTLWLLLATFLIALEIRKPAAHRAWRIAGVALLSLAIAGVLLQPRILRKTSPQALVLTPQYDNKVVDSLLSAHPGLEIYHTPGTKAPNVSSEISTNALAALGDALTFVTGTGLTPAERDALGHGGFSFLPSPPPAGLVFLKHPDEAIAGRTHIIEGVYNNTGTSTTLFVSGPGGAEDSLRCEPGVHPFKLAVTPREAGLYLFSIHHDRDTIGELPLIVREEKKLDVLFVLKYPTFESRQLKSMLEKQHRLLLRYELSRDRFRFEYINRPQASFQRLQENFLSGFDIIIVDTDALRSFSRAEFRQLTQAVESGLGVVVLFNDAPGQREQELFGMAFQPHEKDTVHMIHASGSAAVQVMPVRPAASAEYIPVIETAHDVVSGYTFRGLGRTGFQRAVQTYTFPLRGDSLTFHHLWVPLLEEVSRRQRSGYTWITESAFPHYEDEPVNFRVIAAGSVPPVSTNASTVPLREDIRIDDLWRGKFWAGKPGWQTVFVGDSTQQAIYISPPTQWQSLHYANNIRQTKEMITRTPPAPQDAYTAVPIPLWIFYALFLLSGTLLWLLPKM